MAIMGYPIAGELTRVIKGGAVLDCPVIVADVNRATRIHGPDIVSVRGKTGRKSPKPEDAKDVAVAVETKADLSVNIMFVDNKPHILAVVDHGEHKK